MKPRLLALLCGLIGLGLAGGIAGPDQMMKGLEFTRVSSQHGYNSLSAVQSLSELAATGANWVTIVPVWWMSDTGASNVYRMDEQSPSDEEVRAVIRRAKDVQGLKVFLKPEVHCVSGVWQGLHDPHDKDWFYSYTSFILRFAAIAQKEGCELFSVGSELDRTADEPWERAHWDELINWVKGTYLGPVTYAADWRTFDDIPFWDSLDYVGINAYFPVYHDFLPATHDSLGLMRGRWRQDWLPEIESLLSTLTDTLKQVIFTEVGYRSIRGCAHQPWNEVLSTTFDAREQRYCYIAAFNAFLGRDWFAGWFFHEWPTDPNQGGQYDVGYSPKGKIAGEVLRRWYAAVGTQRCITLEYPRDRFDSYMWPGHAEPSLQNLAATGAEWVSIIPQGWIDTATTSSAIEVRDAATDWPASPSDSSLYTVIGWARQNDLRVVMKPHIDTKRGEFRSSHNPKYQVQCDWFDNYMFYLLRYAAIAESTKSEMMCVGCELDGTVNDAEDIEYWRGLVIPAIRRAYSGPVFYTSLALNGGVSLDLWPDLDFVGVDAYLELFPDNLYPQREHPVPDDTAPGQRPNVEDILVGEDPYNPRAWLQGNSWLDRLAALHDSTHKPLIFPEIGYQPLDSSAWLGARPMSPPWPACSSGTTRDLHGVCFPVDTLIGFVVGDSGTIRKTTDAGRTWRGLDSDRPRVCFRGVHFPTGVQTGFVVGDTGTALRTTNGGSTWTAMDVGTGQDLHAVHFPSPDTGFIVGDSGVVRRTTDGGVTWTVTGPPATLPLRSVHFPTRTFGCVVGDSGRIYRTVDAGVTWGRCQTPTDSLTLRGVRFRDALVGYAVGDSGIYLRTTNAGGGWTARYRQWRGTGERMPCHRAVTIPARPSKTDTSVFIVDDLPSVVRAESAGAAWVLDGCRQITSVETGIRFSAVCFPDSLNGFIVGDAGTIIRTRGGGRARVDFNEQANCYEAAFRAFWGNINRIDPVSWFYGFHWYAWDVQPAPKAVDHEKWLQLMYLQQRSVEDIVTDWYHARPPFSTTGHYVRHYPTGSLDVVVPDDGRGNLPLVQLGLASSSWESDPTGSTPADSARLIQEHLGTGDTVVAIDSTGWFAFKTDTVWQYRFGPGKYRFYVQYKDNPDKQSPRYTDLDHQTISYEAD